MLKLTSPRVAGELLRRYGLRPNQALGQNFIVNPDICPRMAELSGAGPDVCALEIGPGLGTLTAELATRCRRVVAVEADRGLIPLLGETLREFDNIDLIHGDILAPDLAATVHERAAGLPVIVCANLPYYIATPIIMRLLEAPVPGLWAITVMLQREMARRICAPLPSRGAGAVTAAIGWRCHAAILFDVPRGSFLPPPDVDSAVVKLVPRETPPAPVRDEAAVYRVIRAAFAQRRKTLANALSAGLALPKDIALRLLYEAAITPAARAEQLSLADIAKIANSLAKLENM